MWYKNLPILMFMEQWKYKRMEIIMKKRRVIILIAFISGLLIIFGGIYINKPKNNYSEATNNEMVNKGSNNERSNMLNFLSSIAGVKANTIEVINDPIGFKGEIFAPTESIKSGIDYFLNHTKNDKMEDLKIDINEDFVSIYVNYKVTENIKTPIELNISPRLNENKDLELNINQVKLLDLKIADWIVNLTLNSFIADWFPKDGDLKIDFNKGNVVIYKENFKGIILNDILMEENGLKINAIIDMSR